MGHRHLMNSSLQMFEMNQEHYGSHGTAEQSHIHMGRAVAPANGSLFYPMENTPMGGAYSASQQDLGSRPVEHSLSNIRLEGPPPSQTVVSGPTYDPSQQFHSVGSFYPAPVNNTDHAHTSYYNRNSIHNIDNGLTTHTSGNDRGPFERKRPRIPVASEISGSTSTFSAAGSSSTSSGYQLEKPTPDHQNYSSSSVGLPHYHADSLPIGGEGFPRNVRSRLRLDLEPTPRRTYMPNCSSHYCHPNAYLTNHSGPDDIPNSNVGTTAHEQNHIPLFAANGRSSTSENNGISHQMNQFLIEGSTAENNGYRRDPISSRNPILPPQHHHRFQTHLATDGRISYPQRSIPPYQASSSAPRWRHEAGPLGNGPEFLSETYTSRYMRPPSAGGRRHSHRDGRSRTTIERSESFYDAAADSHDGMSSEAFMMVDRSSFYGSRHLFDHYGDMRLDVDNMTYEELLALGERIGNVNTGLSEGMISNCLVEKTSSSTDHDLEEASCPICLEGYKSKDEVGTIKNCGHDYHVSCIKKWLLMKNACPICKAPALSDSLKKQ
ncbi:probable E3 ubiquitin-protein ligase ZFP1 isoform X2 [Ziziphus jujuba]|uniref:RING-type E3 ubiquitin transferase n=2 Tax=Ziziphus jujuba TaxID=326968 RepID=A0ABM4AF71_ZIZJJ|nr:probable E3 ubiquitin-protein ligase ZFP1 isoform X2 [Ziziphus jujuba]XP_048325477.1 probable E3 ubiquitin-protein ligase ZFP1 isoform X2 [Ziziphus jujuba]XP_060675386.1 probable E3 ubiquitin-protein ligase ZFP1 isoform X2 [Ziziphus jujuba]KAH7537397.1 hypothetical protein FEM48_Zijuj03G0088100 [Ziziphus jujuba var. spinosa]